jgi:hypothetical protein
MQALEAIPIPANLINTHVAVFVSLPGSGANSTETIFWLLVGPTLQSAGSPAVVEDAPGHNVWACSSVG